MCEPCAADGRPLLQLAGGALAIWALGAIGRTMTRPAAETRSPDAGLCASCRYAEVITSSRESTFYRCRRSDTDPTFRRYPALPVLVCRGYEHEPAS